MRYAIVIVTLLETPAAQWTKTLVNLSLSAIQSVPFSKCLCKFSELMSLTLIISLYFMLELE